MKVKLNWHYIVDGAEIEIHYIEPEVYPYEPEIYRQCQYRSKSRNEDKCDELLKRIEKLEKEIEVLKERLDGVTSCYKATITSWGGKQ